MISVSPKMLFVFIILLFLVVEVEVLAVVIFGALAAAYRARRAREAEPEEPKLTPPTRELFRLPNGDTETIDLTTWKRRGR